MRKVLLTFRAFLFFFFFKANVLLSKSFPFAFKQMRLLLLLKSFIFALSFCVSQRTSIKHVESLNLFVKKLLKMSRKQRREIRFPLEETSPFQKDLFKINLIKLSQWYFPRFQQNCALSFWMRIKCSFLNSARKFHLFHVSNSRMISARRCSEMPQCDVNNFRGE